jgi:hypothetical protein
MVPNTFPWSSALSIHKYLYIKRIVTNAVIVLYEMASSLVTSH